jgi:N-dimethylarginine dimethylaminohydrolase
LKSHKPRFIRGFFFGTTSSEYYVYAFDVDMQTPTPHFDCQEQSANTVGGRLYREDRAMRFGSQSEVGAIKSLLIKHTKDAFISQENIDDQWQNLNYLGCPDYARALNEYDAFVELLKKQVTDIYFLPQNVKTGLDSLYVHDPVIICEAGAILCNMGKVERGGEPEAAGEFLSELGIPIHGVITGEGRVEGGDVVWLDERTLAIAHGYRTNAEGIHQLRELTRDLVDEFIVMPLPHWTGPGDCLHMMSNISPVDKDLAVVYSRLLTVPFRDYLLERGIELIEVPDSERDSMACNVLALAPRKVIVISGNPLTRKMLEDKGVEVFEYVGEEISKVGAGGATCLTRPLLRK